MLPKTTTGPSARDRFQRSLKAIKAWCWFHRHLKTRAIPPQGLPTIRSGV